jgi:hypothetical protein
VHRAPFRALILASALICSGLLVCGPSVARDARPILIGALNASWGPTPQVVALRDRLLKLGYRENLDFVVGVRFTQGDLAALTGAASQLVQGGVVALRQRP